MYKTLLLFTSLITTNANPFTSINVIKNAYTHIYKNTKVIKNALLINAWVLLKLFIVLALLK